jgi:GrpB-like predicted nucleotidyltransferase (UPF0157 family)
MPTAMNRPTRYTDVTSAELVGGPERRVLTIVPYDPTWPERFQEHRDAISTTLGPVAVRVEHIGSTSVPGLGAKPIIDILVTVDDITAEEDYLPPLLAAGYQLRVREPGHRMVRTPSRDTHVHILQDDASEAHDYLVLRDWLRQHDADRALYEKVKRSLADQEWADMNSYAEAKTDVIVAIMGRASEQN